VPLFLARGLHFDKVGAGWWAGVSFFVMSAVSAALLLPAGRYSDANGRWPVLRTGLIAAGAGLVILAVWPGLPALLVSSVLLGCEVPLLSTASAAMVGDVVGGRGGTVISTYQMAGDVGTSLGAVAGGATADAFGYPVAFAVSAAALVIPFAVATASRALVPASPVRAIRPPVDADPLTSSNDVGEC
jgi:MFS family permease